MRPLRRRWQALLPLLVGAWAGAWAGEPEALVAEAGCRCAAPPAEAFAGQRAVRAAAVWGGGGGQPHPCHAEVAPGLHVLYAYEDNRTAGFAVQFPAEGYCSAALTDLRHKGKMYYAAGWLATFDAEGLPDARHVRITGDSRYSVKDFDRARLEDGYGHGYGDQTDKFINATGVSFELAEGDTPVTTLYFSAPVIAGPFDGRLMPPAVVVGENYFSYAYKPGSGRMVYHLGYAGGFTVNLCSPAEAGFREEPGEGDADEEDETDILDGALPGGATSGDPAPAAEAEAESTEPAPAGGTVAGVEAEEEVEAEAVPAEVAVPATEAEHEAAAVKEEETEPPPPPPPDEYPYKHFAVAAAAVGVAAVAVAGAAGYVAKARCARQAYLQLELEELQGGAQQRPDI